MKAKTSDLTSFNPKYKKTVSPIKKVLLIKEIGNLISYLICTIRFNVSLTITVLLQFKRKYKLKKT